MTSPNVIFNCRYTYALNHNDNRLSKKSKKSINKKIVGMFDYYSNEEKRVMTMFDYYTGDLNKSETMNLVKEDGKYATSKDIDIRKMQYKKYINNSNLWQGVISFNNDYIDSHIELKELEQRLIKQVIPKFFSECGFKDIKNMSYQIALHSDTDNYHFHFSFIEKKPNYVTKINKLQYRRKGKLSQHEIDFLKNQVLLSIEREKEFRPLVTGVNQDLEELKKYFKVGTKNFVLKDKANLILEANILKLGQLLYDNNNKIKYNSIDDQAIKQLTQNIKKYIFNNTNKNLNKDYNCFINSLKEINKYFINLNKRNNIENSFNNKYVVNKEQYLDNYVFNSIVNYSKKYYAYKSKKNIKIKSEDIIQEIILKDYIKNKRQSKLDIIKNYLINSANESKYKNAYKIRNAIKNINNEFAEAQKEFSKMFQNNEYSKM